MLTPPQQAVEIAPVEAAERGEADLPGLLCAMAQRSHDQGRTPVQWGASPGVGFTTGTPWLAINPDHVTVNAAAQAGDPARSSSSATAG